MSPLVSVRLSYAYIAHDCDSGALGLQSCEGLFIALY